MDIISIIQRQSQNLSRAASLQIMKYSSQKKENSASWWTHWFRELDSRSTLSWSSHLLQVISLVLKTFYLFISFFIFISPQRRQQQQQVVENNMETTPATKPNLQQRHKNVPNLFARKALLRHVKSLKTNPVLRLAGHTAVGGENDDEVGNDIEKEELPYPGFTAKALFCLSQTTKPRSWCLVLVTWKYPLWFMSSDCIVRFNVQMKWSQFNSWTA